MKRFALLILISIIFLFVGHTAHANAADNQNVYDLLNNGATSGDSTNDSPDDSDQNQNSLVSEDAKPSLLVDFLKMIIALVLVLGLIYVLLKYLQKRTRIYQQVRTLENLGGISLGNNKSVQLVRIGKKVYALGVGENITFLKEITDEETVSELFNENQEPNRSINQSFQSIWQKWNKSKQKQDSATAFKQLFQDELTSMQKEREKAIDRYRGRKED
ncbi:MAG: flagellar biosynthetic protein FliO [Bacillaceae bacterium]|nr:flagellar biosynthetic protein FliO [Bacillaceae bacterium]